MNCNTMPIEIETVASGEYESRVASHYGPIIRSDRKKTEVWDNLKQDFSEIGIAGRTFDSLASIPLVETALDDGVITQDDKDKILLVLKNLRLLTSGIDPKLKEIWAPFKGRTGFLIVWTVYLRDLSRQMSPEQKITLKALIIEACKFMLRTIGGFLKVPDFEDRIMVAIESAFADETRSFYQKRETFSIRQPAFVLAGKFRRV